MKTRYLFGLPFVSISVQEKETEFLVDTGFNGALLMPIEMINKIQLEPIAVTKYALANGSTETSEVFVAEIEWLGEKSRVSVVGGNSDFTLLGMNLIKGTRMIVEPSKEVLIIAKSA